MKKPLTTMVPLAAAAPAALEFRAPAVKRDMEIWVAREVKQVIVRGRVGRSDAEEDVWPIRTI